MTTVREFKVRIESEILHWPNATVEFQRTKRHQRAVIKYQGKTHTCDFPTSSSDWRGVQNTVSDVRRNLRAMGAMRKKNCNDN